MTTSSPALYRNQSHVTPVDLQTRGSSPTTNTHSALPHIRVFLTLRDFWTNAVSPMSPLHRGQKSRNPGWYPAERMVTLSNEVVAEKKVADVYQRSRTLWKKEGSSADRTNYCPIRWHSHFHKGLWANWRRTHSWCHPGPDPLTVWRWKIPPDPMLMNLCIRFGS